jgi:ribosomal protein S17
MGGAQFIGRVVSNRMQKTVVVAVDYLAYLPKLKVWGLNGSGGSGGRGCSECGGAEEQRAPGRGGAPAGAPARLQRSGRPPTACRRSNHPKSPREPPAAPAPQTYEKRTSKHFAHADGDFGALDIGDVVRIHWTRRLSKHKHYRVSELLRKAHVYTPALGAAAAAARGGAEQRDAVAVAEAAVAAAGARLRALREAYGQEPGAAVNGAGAGGGDSSSGGDGAAASSGSGSSSPSSPGGSGPAGGAS